MLKVHVKNGDVVRFIEKDSEFNVGDIAVCVDSEQQKYLGIYGNKLLRVCQTEQPMELVRQHELHLMPELSTLRALHKQHLFEPFVSGPNRVRSASELCGKVVRFINSGGRFSNEDYAICLNGDSRLYLGLSGTEFMQVWYDYGSVELVGMDNSRYVRTMIKTRISIAHTTKLFRKAYSDLVSSKTVIV